MIDEKRRSRSNFASLNSIQVCLNLCSYIIIVSIKEEARKYRQNIKEEITSL